MAAGRRKVSEERGETGAERTEPGWRPVCVSSEHGKGAGRGTNVEFAMSASTATDDETQRNDLHRCPKGPAPPWTAALRCTIHFPRWTRLHFDLIDCLLVYM